MNGSCTRSVQSTVVLKILVFFSKKLDHDVILYARHTRYRVLPKNTDQADRHRVENFQVSVRVRFRRFNSSIPTGHERRCDIVLRNSVMNFAPNRHVFVHKTSRTMRNYNIHYVE